MLLPVLELEFGLLLMDDPEFAPGLPPFPRTFNLSTTLRLPAKDCAIRFAVARSLPVSTLPVSSIFESVTLTITLLLASVGSFFSAVWIWP